MAASARKRRERVTVYVALQVPPNGLVLYTGTILTEDGKEKKVNIDFEPFRPINTRCVEAGKMDARGPTSGVGPAPARAARP